MSHGCTEGQYWDGLVRKCLSCQMMCQTTRQRPRCTEYCVSQGCRAVSGHFYDRLLKKCLQCAAVCGSHPSECSQECQTHQSLDATQRPADGAALQPFGPRGSSNPGGAHPYTAVMVSSLLGLGLAVLVCTLSVALLVLLRRARGPKTQPGPPEGRQPDENVNRVPDGLTERAEAASRDRSGEARSGAGATETCVHCFPQQREAMSLAGTTDATATRSCDETGALRIVCSPTQSSM